MDPYSRIRIHMQCIWIHQTVTIHKHIKIYTGRLRNSNPDPAQLLIRIQIHNHDKYNILVFFLSQRGQPGPCGTAVSLVRAAFCRNSSTPSVSTTFNGRPSLQYTRKSRTHKYTDTQFNVLLVHNLFHGTSLGKKS